jgi:hypothetical protein
MGNHATHDRRGQKYGDDDDRILKHSLETV